MGIYTTSTITGPRQDIAQALQEYDAQIAADSFIARKVFPAFQVASKFGTYPVVPKEALLSTPASLERASGAGYHRSDIEFSINSYRCREQGEEVPIDSSLAAVYGNTIEVDLIAAQKARLTVLRNEEIRAATALFNTSTFTTTNVSTEWSTIASADPVADVLAARRRVKAATGVWPNAVAVSQTVFDNLRRCESILDKIKQVQNVSVGNVNEALVAQALDVEYVFVAGGCKASTAEGAATMSVADIWDDEYAAVFRVDYSRDITRVSTGRTFHWDEDGTAVDGVPDVYYQDETRCYIMRYRLCTDLHVAYPESCQLLGNITA